MEVKAARLVEHGKALEVTGIELPEPGGDELVVDLQYAGVNPVDRYRAAGRVDADAPLPRVLGAEGAGTVDGRPVAVFGHGLGTTRDGLWATRQVVPRAAVLDLPDGVDPKQAAVMGIAGLTAWRTATELARLTADDRVLVLGGSGGVGSIIVSIAHRIGATVWAQTGDPANEQWLRAAGADRVVAGGADTLREQLEWLRPTAVFDPLGGEFTGPALESLVPHGRLVIFGTSAGATGTLSLQAIYRSSLRILGYGGLQESDESLDRGLAEALRALADGRLDVTIGKTMPLTQVNEAFELLANRKVNGKVVLDLRQ